jgi:glycosyltransferase involved in cell wall biosynthesis
VEGESRELVLEAQAGLAIEPENAQQLAEAVLRLTDAPDERRSFGQKGYEYVCSNFDRRVLAGRYVDVLRETVGKYR